MTAPHDRATAPIVHPVRQFLSHRYLATALCALALLVRLAVPGGYMVQRDHGAVTVMICPGSMASTDAAMSMAGHRGMAGHDRSSHHGKGEAPCAFAGLGAALLAATDPILLAGLIAFVLALIAGRTTMALPRAAPRLRPPLRGPPAHA